MFYELRLTGNIRLDLVLPMPKATFKQIWAFLKIEHLQKGRGDCVNRCCKIWSCIYYFDYWCAPPPQFWGKHLGGRDSHKLELIPCSKQQRSVLLEFASYLEFEMHFPKQCDQFQFTCFLHLSLPLTISLLGCSSFWALFPGWSTKG